MTFVLRNVFALWAALAAAGAQAQELSRYTQNVLLHVIAHEMAHALIREFDLPILGNEEVMADAFATLHLAQIAPTSIHGIIADRAASWMEEADDTSLFAEHPSDIRRVGQMLCHYTALFPDEAEDLARDMGMTAREARACADRTAEVARAWRRILVPIVMPTDAPVTEVAVLVGEGPWEAAIRSSAMMGTAQSMLEGFDWHSLITLHFDNCDQGAVWQRRAKRILICDDLIARFEAQADRLGR